MARLRAAPTATPVFFPTPSAERPTRSSPRKAAQESPSKRVPQYTISDDEDEPPFLVPKKSPEKGDTPRKQRALKPVASHSQLLRRLSNEKLRAPEKRVRVEKETLRGEGEVRGRGMTYARGLARTVVRSGVGQKTGGREGQRKEDLAVKEQQVGIASKEEVEDAAVEEDEEDVDQSLWCGNDEDAPDQSVEPEVETTQNEYEDDEDPVVNVRDQRRRLQNRIVESESESDYEEEENGEEEAEQEEAEEEERDKAEELVAAIAEVHIQEEQLRPEPSVLRSAREMPLPLVSARPPHRKGHSTISNWAQEVIDLTSSPEAPASFVLPPPSTTRPTSSGVSSRPTTSSTNDAGGFLQYSPTPTKLRSPRKAPPVSRPATPPAPPSPSKLVSPSKKKNRIPQAPDLRPSLDAFWAVDVVNNWNDAHSPAKTLLSPRKQKWLQGLEKLDPTSSSDEDAPFPSPTTSPRKKNNPAPSPSKKPSNSTSPSPSQLRAQRKAFATTKHTLAASFLTELDETITSGKIASLSASTGGIKLIWSKTLKTTAGRANWRREPIRRKIGPSITDIATSYRHHCSIELAEKVIDDEERLYNVLAHEYCHLTTFMISEVRNNPHGKEFKTWAAEVSRRFEQKGVHVTTKHSYQIEYKYVWTCVGCGYEFKRHSKSVDTSRHSCGRCKGKLVQTKPTPRGGGGAADGKEGKPREKSEYQVFVKENFARVKRELGEKGLDTQMGRVMETVAREYREAKERKAGLGEVEELLGGLKI